MASEVKIPDALLIQTNLSGAVTAIDEDPDAPGADWLTAASNNADSICVVSFPTPTGNPTGGSGLQNFKWWARLTPNATACTYNVYLRESGVRLNGGVAIATGSLTSTSGQLITATWDAALLGTPDGSVVEAELVVTKSGGAPGARTTGEVGAVEWNVEYSGLTAVGKSLATNYDLLNLAGRASAFNYDSFALAGRSVAFNYNADGAVGRSVGVPYDIINFAGRSAAFPYDVNVLAGRSAAMAYDMAQLAARSSAFAYNMDGAVGRSLAAAYDLLNLAGKGAAFPYDVRVLAGRSAVFVYDSAQLAAKAVAFAYDIEGTGGAVGRSAAFAYDMEDGTGITAVGRTLFIHYRLGEFVVRLMQKTCTTATVPNASDFVAGSVIYVSDAATGQRFKGNYGGTWENLG